MKILFVDDDPKLREILGEGLAEAGFEARGAADAEQARVACRESGFDLILLDVMLPGDSGFDLLRELRESGVTTPVIFLTARQAVDERVQGLKLGADDYVIKPFAFEELFARIDAVLRRREASTTGPIDLGRLQIDELARTVAYEGQRIEMSPREFELLQTLAHSVGRTISRSELLSTIWGIEFEPGTNVVEVLVARLRRRLNQVVSPRIETVVGEGYRLMQIDGEELA